MSRRGDALDLKGVKEEIDLDLKYEYQDMSLDEQTDLFNRGLISKEDHRWMTLQQQGNQRALLIAKRDQFWDSSKKKAFEFSQELVRLDPLNPKILRTHGTLCTWLDYYRPVYRFFECALLLDSKQLDLKADIRRYRQKASELSIKNYSNYKHHAHVGDEMFSSINSDERSSHLVTKEVFSNHLMACRFSLWAGEETESDVYYNNGVSHIRSAFYYAKWAGNSIPSNSYGEFGVLCSRVKDYSNAIKYLNTAINKKCYTIGINNLFFERGFIYLQQGKLSLAIADLEKSLKQESTQESPSSCYVMTKIILREERAKRLATLKQEAQRKAVEEKAREDRIRQATALCESAKEVYRNGNIGLASQVADKAIAIYPLAEAWLCKALVNVRQNNRPGAIRFLETVLSLDTPSNYSRDMKKLIQQLYDLLNSQEQKANQQLLEYKIWLKRLPSQIIDGTISGALQGIRPAKDLGLEPLPPLCEGDLVMARKKREKFGELVVTCLNNNKFREATPAQFECEMLIYRLAQALQPFFDSQQKKTSCRSSQVKVHFRVKVGRILSDVPLKSAVNQAFSQTIPEKRTQKLKDQATQINFDEIAHSMTVIHTSCFPQADLKVEFPKRELEPTHPSFWLERPIVQAKDVKDSAPPSLLPTEQKQSQVMTSVGLFPRVEDEAIRELQVWKKTLFDLKNANIETPENLKALHQRFQQHETTALKLKSVDYFVLRGDFYYRSAKVSGGAQQTALYANALQDYRLALSYNPFAEGASERIQEIEETTLKRQTTNAGLFEDKKSDLTREDLSREELQRLEQIKERLRQSQASSGTSITLSSGNS